jgi:hypothetical protein
VVSYLACPKLLGTKILVVVVDVVAGHILLVEREFP